MTLPPRAAEEINRSRRAPRVGLPGLGARGTACGHRARPPDAWIGSEERARWYAGAAKKKKKKKSFGRPETESPETETETGDWSGGDTVPQIKYAV